MKNTKSVLAAALALVAMNGAQATTTSSQSHVVINIGGSSAFRSAANQSLMDNYPNKVYASSGASLTDNSASFLYITNAFTNSGTIYDISAGWNGSAAGIQSVSSVGVAGAQATLPLYTYAAVGAGFGKNAPDYTKALGSSARTNGVAAEVILDVAFSDASQNYSPFPGGAPGADGRTYNDCSANETQIGVTPFTYVASKNFPFTNVTTTIAANLCGTGYQFLNAFPESVNPSVDSNSVVWLFGRNLDSGTRLQTLLINGYANTGTAVHQYQGGNLVSGVYGSVTNTPSGTVLGVTVSTGDNGEFSGGTLCKNLTNLFANGNILSSGGTGVNTGVSSNFAIGYAGVADSQGQLANGLKMLAFNGVQPHGYTNSTTKPTYLTDSYQGYTNIITGRYPFWSYEVITCDPNVVPDLTTPPSGAAAFGVYTVYNDAVTKITSPTYIHTASHFYPNIALSEMKVKRSVDGGNIVPVGR